MLTILIFIAVLSILVFVHEFGHFLVAKRLGIGVEEFGFGLPPRIWGKQIGETTYSINWLPIGGFVRLAGEDVEEQTVDSKQQTVSSRQRTVELKKLFYNRSKKERAAVLLAGVVMNFILAVAILSYLLTNGIVIPGGVTIAEIAPGSPAQTVGLTAKDKIIRIDGTDVEDVNKVARIVAQKKGKEVKLTILRGDKTSEEKTISVIPRTNPPAGEGALGIKMQQEVKELRYPWYKAPIYGLIWGFRFSWEMLSALWGLLVQLVTFQHVDADQVSGPIGIAQAIGQAAKYGLLEVIKITGILSLNLAVMNLLPIPALDGGRLLFVVLEKFIGKRVKPTVERAAHQVGIAFLLALIFLVTVNDILRLIRG